MDNFFHGCVYNIKHNPINYKINILKNKCMNYMIANKTENVLGTFSAFLKGQKLT